MARAHAAQLLTPVWTVESSAGRMEFAGPSGRSLHDAYGFNRDEPETVAWIETLPKDAILWDIGANVGVYTIFAAKRGVRVLAFEPAISTMAVLMANIERNRVEHLAAAYPVALAAETKLGSLYMQRGHTEAGHSIHSFETRETVEGAIADPFLQPALGFSADDFIAQFGAPAPTHIKLDVDGIEPAILRGAQRTLRASVREVMVETYAEAAHDPIRRLLAEAGFAETATVNAAGRNKLFRRA